MRHYSGEWEPEEWEPGHDPGPDETEDWPVGTCDVCGAEDEAISPNGACYDCETEAREDARYCGGDDDPIDGVGFADPGGRSALRAATRANPRIHPCPSCGAENVLTPADVARGYQCDRCADACERGGW